MTKQDAIGVMTQGVKVTHDTFSNEEWITMKDDSILTEEGYLMNPIEFWSYRQNKSFDDGWYLYNSYTN